MLGRLGEGCEICCAATTRLNTAPNNSDLEVIVRSFPLASSTESWPDIEVVAERQARGGGQG